MDMFQKLKITQKGPNSSGSRSDSKTISSERRSLHPSHVGRQDINVCSASDPGLTNYITPLCETDGLYFKDAPPEPESFYINFKKSLGEIDENGDQILIIDPVKYNSVLQAVSRSAIYHMEDIDKVNSTSSEIYDDTDDVDNLSEDELTDEEVDELDDMDEEVVEE